MPDTLRSFTELLTQYGELDFIHGRMTYFEDGTDNMRKMPYFIDNKWFLYTPTGKEAFCKAYQYQGNLQMGVRGLYNRDFLVNNNLFFVERHIPWGEDEEWTPRVFACATKCAGNDKAFYCYREARKGSETSRLLNIDTGVTMLKVYDQWVKMCENDSDLIFRETLMKEAGNRYFSCLFKYSKLRQFSDIKVFSSQAKQFDYLLHFSESRGKKSKLLKPFYRLLGVYCFEIMLFFVRKVIRV